MPQIQTSVSFTKQEVTALLTEAAKKSMDIKGASTSKLETLNGEVPKEAKEDFIAATIIVTPQGAR